MRVYFQTSDHLTEGNIHRVMRIFDSITRTEGMSSTIKILNANEIVKHIDNLYRLDDVEKILDLSPPLRIIQISVPKESSRTKHRSIQQVARTITKVFQIHRSEYIAQQKCKLPYPRLFKISLLVKRPWTCKNFNLGLRQL